MKSSEAVLYNCFLLEPKDLAWIFNFCNTKTLRCCRQNLKNLKNFVEEKLVIFNGVPDDEFRQYLKDKFPDKDFSSVERVRLRKELQKSSFFTNNKNISTEEYTTLKNDFDSKSMLSFYVKVPSDTIPIWVDKGRIKAGSESEKYILIKLSQIQVKIVKSVLDRFCRKVSETEYRTQDIDRLIQLVDECLMRKPINTLFNRELNKIMEYSNVSYIVRAISPDANNLRTALNEIKRLRARYFDSEEDNFSQYMSMLHDLSKEISSGYAKEYLVNLTHSDYILDFALKEILGDAYEVRYPETYENYISNGKTIESLWKLNYENLVMYHVLLKISKCAKLYLVDNDYYNNRLFNFTNTEEEDELEILKSFWELNELGLTGISMDTSLESISLLERIRRDGEYHYAFLNPNLTLISSKDLYNNDNINFILNSLEPLIKNELELTI